MRVLREPARSVGGWRRRTTVALGVVIGAAVGGGLLSTVGYLGYVVHPGPNLVWGLLFLIGFLGALLGMVSPISVFVFLGTRQESRKMEELLRAAGLASVFVFYPLGGWVAMVVLEKTALTVESTLQFLVALDAVGGVTAGGIVGLVVAERRLERSVAERTRG